MAPNGTAFRVAKDQVSANLDGEVVLLGLQKGQYYGLDAVGAKVWELLQEPVTLEQMRDAIVEEYEVEPEDCERDLVVLLDRMRREGLIEVSDAGSA